VPLSRTANVYLNPSRTEWVIVGRES
jgi:hypothetical protein